MPKLKTNKAAKKRFKITAKGKILRPCSGGNHLMNHKSAKRRRKVRNGTTVGATHFDLIIKLFPNRKKGN